MVEYSNLKKLVLVLRFLNLAIFLLHTFSIKARVDLMVSLKTAFHIIVARPC